MSLSNRRFHNLHLSKEDNILFFKYCSPKQNKIVRPIKLIVNINSKIRYNSKRFNKSKLNIKQLRKMVIGHIVDFVKFVQK